MNKGLIITILVLVLVVLLGFVFLLNTDKGRDLSQGIENVFESVNQNPGNSDTSNDFEIYGDDINPNFGSSSGGGGGGGGGSGGSSGGTTTSQNCEQIQITYFLIDPNKTETCNSYNGTICEDKTIDCSIEVHNEDETTSGNFDLRVLFAEEGKQKGGVFDIKSSTLFINAQTKEILQKTTSVRSSGEDGLANKNMVCFFEATNVPTKQICT